MSKCHNCPVFNGNTCRGELHPRLCELQQRDPGYRDLLLRGAGVLVPGPLLRVDRDPQQYGDRLLVVSRWDEDVAWCNDLDMPVIVYNKGQAIEGLASHVGIRHTENRGREAGTILQAIIDHYDRLPEIMFFVQAETHADHLKNRLKLDYARPTSLTCEYKDDFPSPSVKALDHVLYHGGHEVRYGNVAWHGDRTPERNEAWLSSIWLHWFTSPRPDPWIFGYAAEWAVPRASILARPLEFWRYALQQVNTATTDPHQWDSEPTTAWAMEAIWLYLFDPAYKTKWQLPALPALVTLPTLAPAPPVPARVIHKSGCGCGGGSPRPRQGPGSLTEARREAIRKATTDPYKWNEMDIDVYTFARNEEGMLPFFLRHYSFARKIILYDDGSSNRTLEIARADPRVTVRDACLGDCYDEDVFRDLKNNCWKGSDADWVVVCDIDEFLHHPNLWGQLLSYREMQITLPKVQGFEMVSEDGLPFHDGRLTDVIKMGVASKLYSKQVIFNPEKIREINYVHGAHACEPQGDVVVGGDLQLLHFNMLGTEYIVDRWAQRRARVSPQAAGRRWKTFDWADEELRGHHGKLVRDARLVI